MGPVLVKQVDGQGEWEVGGNGELDTSADFEIRRPLHIAGASLHLSVVSTCCIALPFIACDTMMVLQLSMVSTCCIASLFITSFTVTIASLSHPLR
jgi:hypothetical protein